MNLKFDSLLPEEMTQYGGHLILTTEKESPTHFDKPILYEEIFEKHPTIVRGLIIQQLDNGFEEDELILGIDPGSRIGLAIFYFGREIESSFYSSIEHLVSHLIVILGGLRSKRKIVKIGNGNMVIAKKIGEMLNLKFCSDFELEFVDERRTSPKIKNFNRRGKRDMLSAKYITQREGYRHYVLPLSITG